MGLLPPKLLYKILLKLIFTRWDFLGAGAVLGQETLLCVPCVPAAVTEGQKAHLSTTKKEEFALVQLQQEATVKSLLSTYPQLMGSDFPNSSAQSLHPVGMLAFPSSEETKHSTTLRMSLGSSWGLFSEFSSG